MNKTQNTMLPENYNKETDENQKVMIISHVIIRDKETKETIFNKRLS
jgi:hypothetical protein